MSELCNYVYVGRLLVGTTAQFYISVAHLFLSFATVAQMLTSDKSVNIFSNSWDLLQFVFETLVLLVICDVDFWDDGAFIDSFVLMIDIEDIPLQIGNQRRTDEVRVTKIGRPLNEKHNGELRESFVPGTQSVWVKTWGCSHNTSDSEYMYVDLTFFICMLNSGRACFTAQAIQLFLVKKMHPCGFSTHVPSKHLRKRKHSILSMKQQSSIRLWSLRVAFHRCKYLIVLETVQAAPNDPSLKGISIVGVQQIDRVVEVR